MPLRSICVQDAQALIPVRLHVRDIAFGAACIHGAAAVSLRLCRVWEVREAAYWRVSVARPILSLYPPTWANLYKS